MASVFQLDEADSVIQFHIKSGDEESVVKKDLWLLHDMFVTWDEENRKTFADDIAGYDDAQQAFFEKLGFPANLSYRSRNRIISRVYSEVAVQKKEPSSPPAN